MNSEVQWSSVCIFCFLCFNFFHYSWVFYGRFAPTRVRSLAINAHPVMWSLREPRCHTLALGWTLAAFIVQSLSCHPGKWAPTHLFIPHGQEREETKVLKLTLSRHVRELWKAESNQTKSFNPWRKRSRYFCSTKTNGTLSSPGVTGLLSKSLNMPSVVWAWYDVGICPHSLYPYYTHWAVLFIDA